jgi:hypothetical protein
LRIIKFGTLLPFAPAARHLAKHFTRNENPPPTNHPPIRVSPPPPLWCVSRADCRPIYICTTQTRGLYENSIIVRHDDSIMSKPSSSWAPLGLLSRPGRYLPTDGPTNKRTNESTNTADAQLYKARMLHASVAYVCEALIVVPALLIIGKFPNRGGNKRIRIMKSLLFYILMNSLIQALQRGFLAAGYFAEYRGGPTRTEHQSQQQQRQQQPQSQQHQSAVAAPLVVPLSMLNGSVQHDASQLGAVLKATSAPLADQMAASKRAAYDEVVARPRLARNSESSSSWSLATGPHEQIGAQRRGRRKAAAVASHATVQHDRREVADSHLDTAGTDFDDSEPATAAHIFPTGQDNRHSKPPWLDAAASGGQRVSQIDNLNRVIDESSRRFDQPALGSLDSSDGRLAIGAERAPAEWLANEQIDALSRGDYILAKYQLMSSADRTGSVLNNNSIRLTSTETTETNLAPHRQAHYVGRSLQTQVPGSDEGMRAIVRSSSNYERHKRDSTNNTIDSGNSSQKQRFQSQISRTKRKESAWKALFCWSLQMASRLVSDQHTCQLSTNRHGQKRLTESNSTTTNRRQVRLMSYAWMFTGGVYLCSALHFAPAEPPVKFIKILFFLTNAFPNLIFFAYVTARTINEPSPLNIIIKGAYHWYYGNDSEIEHLLETQKVCWFEESKSQRIEDIADLPNLILVASNVALFVITLVILCRINRPGSTRPDMSPCAYFKAAGTLLFLYGGHYFFLAYRPESE